MLLLWRTKEFLNSQDKQKPHIQDQGVKRRRIPVKWRPPPRAWLKINCDASFNHGSNSGANAAIIRGSHIAGDGTVADASARPPAPQSRSRIARASSGGATLPVEDEVPVTDPESPLSSFTSATRNLFLALQLCVCCVTVGVMGGEGLANRFKIRDKNFDSSTIEDLMKLFEIESYKAWAAAELEQQKEV
ncbi:hypothetical protein PIB30_031658 [Stylosanthes scabra]|uniref:Uncharacterized protein n=1 Tax=Stylosanthes scabra TaxID=79078 RepID=A0ABU6Y951_9FABA|nr:hypothetical protein [Stylosanthes scabra]